MGQHVPLGMTALRNCGPSEWRVNTMTLIVDVVILALSDRAEYIQEVRADLFHDVEGWQTSRNIVLVPDVILPRYVNDGTA